MIKNNIADYWQTSRSNAKTEIFI